MMRLISVLLVLAVTGGVAGAQAKVEAKVTVKSTTDSSQSTSASESKRLQGVMRRTIDRLVARAPVTLPANRNVDANLVSLTSELVGTNMVVTSVVNVVISDDAGNVTSVLSGSAKAEMAGNAVSRLVFLREEAIIGALENGYLKVKDRLHGKR